VPVQIQNCAVNFVSKEKQVIDRLTYSDWCFDSAADGSARNLCSWRSRVSRQCGIREWLARMTEKQHNSIGFDNNEMCFDRKKNC
jgi:hypothetical protein